MKMSFIPIISFFILLCSTKTISQTPNHPLSDKLRNDSVSLELASIDYGHIVKEVPKSVFFPTSINDVAVLVQEVNALSLGSVAARGRGHSVRGQAMAGNGIVINMTSLASDPHGVGIWVVPESPDLGPYVDVGGEQIWYNVLVETLKLGLSPVSFTDYLHLSVGGTLSNAGISGQTFRYGPQINNVHELDVITGKGDFVTCSRDNHSDLFYSVLGGLGQFGIITRARIGLELAPTRAKWVRLFYNDFSAFSKDQEFLISMNARNETKGVQYLEGFLLMKQSPLDLSFYPNADHLRIKSLVSQYGIVYAIELAKYYDDSTQSTVEKELQILLDLLSFVKGFSFEKDVTYLDFLNRVGSEEQKLRDLGLWDVPHPWLNLFIPKPQIPDFDSGVLKGILIQEKVPAALINFYPMNRNKWDDRMSAMIPSEDVFYTVALLHSSGFNEWQAFDKVNKQILQLCHDSGIMVKQYLPHYETQQDWSDHFGPKWDHFLQMKKLFDPKKILSPGQKIFTQ